MSALHLYHVKQTKIQPASKVKEKAANAWNIQNEIPNNESKSLLPFKCFEHSDWVRSIAYSPNGNQLAAGGDDNKVTIYDLENKGAILHTFEHSSMSKALHTHQMAIKSLLVVMIIKLLYMI